MFYAEKYASPVGTLLICADEHAITRITLGGALPLDSRASDLTRTAVSQLSEYFAGTRREFDLPINPAGTEFRRRVWCELVSVPYGQRVTYGELAARIDTPRAARAVGGAVGANPILIVIPCHRVVARDGIGGFSAGVEVKRYLIGLEKIKLIRE